MDSSSALIGQGKSVLKVFQQLKINPAYRDPIRDLFAQLGTAIKRRRTVKARASVRSTTPKASKGSAK
jgi:hypothetical protein